MPRLPYPDAFGVLGMSGTMSKQSLPRFAADSAHGMNVILNGASKVPKGGFRVIEQKLDNI